MKNMQFITVTIYIMNICNTTGSEGRRSKGSPLHIVLIMIYIWIGRNFKIQT